MQNDQLRSPADSLASIIEALPSGGVTVGEMRDLVGRDGLMLLAAFLTIVFLVPVSIPGVSTAFGAVILLIGGTRLVGRDLWLPRRIAQRSVSSQKLRTTLERGLAIVRRLERVSRPNRVAWMTTSRYARVVNDSALVAGAILLMAPFGLIPFSNTLPAVALLFLALGSLQRDGVCIVLGHCAILATALYFAALLGGGAMAATSLTEILR